MDIQRYLPLVNGDTGLPIARDLKGRPDEEYIQEQLLWMKQENPVIVEFISEFANSTDDRLGALFSSVLVYKLLRSQAEADRMKDEIMLE